MVRMILYLLCYMLGIGTILHAAPTVEADIDATSSQAHFPLQGIITITHRQEEIIDPRSFTLEGKPLDVSLVKDVKMSAYSDTLVAIYNFQLPAQEKGLYVLPSISVKIGDQVYQTTPSTYEVQEEVATPSSTQSSIPTLFRLEAFVQGPSTLYPGERTKLVYRISYNRSIDLTRSTFPLIHPAHFQKVGDVQVKDYQLKDVTVQDLIQEVEASELGTFSFGPSQIEGYAYTLQNGQKIYDSTLLKAEAPLVTLEVKPFPKSVEPASFTGALGQIQAEAHLTSADSVSVGDTLQLQVKIAGVSNLGELSLPLLQCQPGFSGFFQMSDLPPLAEVKDKEKFFYVELRPLSSLIKQIPAIEVSSFDAKTGKYLVQQTNPIPITIRSSPVEVTAIAVIPLTSISSVDRWPAPPLPPLEIEGEEVRDDQKTHSWIESAAVLWMIPLGCLLLLLQMYWKQRQPHPPQIPLSAKFFKRALKTGNLQELEEAFWYRLWEKGKIPQHSRNLEELSKEKNLNSIQSFIFQLQALQYSDHKTFEFNLLQKQAQQLFDAI